MLEGLPQSGPSLVENKTSGGASPFSQIPVVSPSRAEWFQNPLFFPAPRFRLPIQAKLKVGNINDPLEKEADRVAEQVTLMAAGEVSLSSARPAVSAERAVSDKEGRLQRKPAGTAEAGTREAPASVHKTLRSPGQRLDASIRGYFEPRFGRDFGGVRVHTGVDAERSAREVNAHAYTVGRNIVFGADRFVPNTDEGRRLIAHELTHVVQQSGPGRSGGLPVAFDFAQLGIFSAGREAVQRDDAGTVPGTTPGTTPPVTAPAAATPLKYNRVLFTLAVPDPKWTEATLLARLNTIFKSVALTGVTAAMPKETNLFLYYALLGLSNKDNWGQEIDVVAPIAWPAKAGDPPPRARITARIDDQGNATGELVASGPTPQPAQTTVAAATAKLKQDYKLASVRDDGTATWSDAEISDVVAALAILPAVDKAALKGVELIRVKDLAGGYAGEFSTGGGVTGPALTTLKSLPSLKLATGAFGDKAGVKFYGGTAGTVPASFETILHEVGHAVEKATLRAAAEASDKALIELNKSVIPVNQSAKDYKKLTDDYTKIYAEYDTAKKAGDKAKADGYAAQLLAIRGQQDDLAKKNKAASEKHKTAETAYEGKQAAEKKTRVAAAVVTPLTAEATAKKTASANALSAAKTSIGALAAAEAPTAKPYLDALEATAKAIETFVKSAAAKGDIEALETTVLAQVELRNQAGSALAKTGHPALAALNLAATAQDAWLEAERTSARAPLRTLRVQKFVDLVNANKIAPFTEYAKKNWPFKPQEFYAEAYSLWLVDAIFLSTNYKVVYDFFQSGEYRK